MNRYLFILLFTGAGLSACATNQVAGHCNAPLSRDLDAAMMEVEHRLGSGCQYHFDRYFQQLLSTAEDNPEAENKSRFSDHLVRVNEQGVISQRQAKELYNRYFNVKFVSLTGDYNTCAQTCPVRAEVMNNMQNELRDKQVGLLNASADKTSYYRADHLLKEAQLVLEATCRACSAGGQ